MMSRVRKRAFESSDGNASRAGLALRYDIREVIAECLKQRLLVDLAAEHKLSDKAIRTLFEGFSAVPNKRIFV